MNALRALVVSLLGLGAQSPLTDLVAIGRDVATLLFPPVPQELPPALHGRDTPSTPLPTRANSARFDYPMVRNDGPPLLEWGNRDIFAYVNGRMCLLEADTLRVIWSEPSRPPSAVLLDAFDRPFWISSDEMKYRGDNAAWCSGDSLGSPTRHSGSS
jgi:hypothetical protein